MSDQIEAIIREKILAGVEPPSGGFTRRDARLPAITGKAMVVIGMRRSGKTTFLHQCRADLSAAGRPVRNLLYFNFEDERLGEMEVGQLRLIPEMHARMFPVPDGEVATLFLDEIQRVAGWEVFARRMLDTPGYELFLSGSSARLLSREIATSMRGRGWEIVIHPFSFREFLRHHGHECPPDPALLSGKQRLLMDHHFADYLAGGGFPEAQGLVADERRQLFQSYVDVALLRDVIERYGVTNTTALRWMVRRLLGSPAGLFSVTKFSADLKSQGVPVAKETLYELLAHLEDAFLLRTIPVASDSEKRRQVNPKKVYPVDPGLIPVFDRSGKANRGQALETAVFNELQRRRAEVGYVKTPGGFEVDFLARHAVGGESLIQVCTSVDDPATLTREVRALDAAAKEFPHADRLILTRESRVPFPELPATIRILPAWQWMLA